MRANRSELALLRGKRDPGALELWAKSFGQDKDRAKRYGLAVATFLGQPPPTDSSGGWNDYLGHFSPNTRAAYAFAVTEFFEWAAARHERIVSPDEVTRIDAEQYTNWLANRPFSLASEKLKDGDQADLLALYEIVTERGSATLQEIVDDLKPAQRQKYFGDSGKEEWSRKRVSVDVRKLVTMDVLSASPTLSELRQEYPQAGLTVWTIPAGPKGALISLEDAFTYREKEIRGTSRTTVAQRVSALSSFWQVLMQGENVAGGEPLLQYNVWDAVKKRVNRGMNGYRKEASRKQKMPSDKVIQMLRDAQDRSLVQLRNRALLYLMVFAGVRTTEILMLRRSKPERGEWKAWFDVSELPVLQLLRKGNKWQRLPYPPAALKPLIEFQRELEKHAAPSFAQSTDIHGEAYVPRESFAWYFRDLLLPDAPLFPPLSIWGNNTVTDYRKSMSRIQCYRLLKQMGREVGLTPAEVDMVHPHAIRHFSANAMVSGGKDLREVQTILGHSSVQTTEGYLDDVDEAVRLSGQEAILDYLDAKGAQVTPTYDGSPEVPSRRRAEREVIEVRAEPDIPSDLTDEVQPEELEVLAQLEEEIPEHEFPEAPVDYDPAVVVMAMPGSAPPILETDEGLIGVAGEESPEVLLEDLAQTVRDGCSPGSPAWVYEVMADPKGTHETVIFNRGGERDRDWLEENYAGVPVNFGVGHESYLPWYVKARGNISRGGFFKGRAPFPVYSPDQCNPETDIGEEFLKRVEEAYSQFVHGDPETGRAPSPMRSVGMIRWYSFFVYHGTKYQESGAVPAWHPWNAVVELGGARAHEDAWLVQWLADNAHTYRASIDAMKRGVSRTDSDPTASFLRSSFEGVELVTDVPEWMIEDDPVLALYKSDPRQWQEMIGWLKNVTGQQLEISRQEGREEQEATAVEEQRTQARNIRDVLMGVIRLVDQLERAKHMAKERVPDLRGQLRTQLYWYAVAAGGTPTLRVSLDELKSMSTRDFNKAMAQEYSRLGVPDPNGAAYKGLKGRRKVSALVSELFPTLPELNDGNVFADSKLFNPKWFRIDESAHTVFIERAEREAITRQFGQDPELLVRRATRAMWESKDKGYEALWGVMMSYFSWIVPSGREMESQVLGIPVAELGAEDLNVQARKNWLKAWSYQMKRLAMGEALDEPNEETRERETATSAELAPWEAFLRDEEEKGIAGREDALNRIAGDGVDFAMSTSVSGGYAESPEDLLMAYEESGGDYWANPTRRQLMPNGKSTFVYIEGEQPKRWYRVDLFGRRQGHLRPNAPPVLMSPGALYRSQKKVFGARQLLPSPFRMIAGMDIPSD